MMTKTRWKNYLNLLALIPVMYFTILLIKLCINKAKTGNEPNMLFSIGIMIGFVIMFVLCNSIWKKRKH